MGYLFLGIALLICGAVWAKKWFHKQMLVAYLTTKGVPMPEVEELADCARIVWDDLLHR